MKITEKLGERTSGVINSGQNSDCHQKRNPDVIILGKIIVTQVYLSAKSDRSRSYKDYRKEKIKVNYHSQI